MWHIPNTINHFGTAVPFSGTNNSESEWLVPKSGLQQYRSGCSTTEIKGFSEIYIWSRVFRNIWSAFCERNRCCREKRALTKTIAPPCVRTEKSSKVAVCNLNGFQPLARITEKNHPLWTLNPPPHTAVGVKAWKSLEAVCLMSARLPQPTTTINRCQIRRALGLCHFRYFGIHHVVRDDTYLIGRFFRTYVQNSHSAASPRGCRSSMARSVVRALV